VAADYETKIWHRWRRRVVEPGIGYVTRAAIVIDSGLSLTNWFDPPVLDDL